MALDNALLNRYLKNALAASASHRVAKKDGIEAKANVIVKRTLTEHLRPAPAPLATLEHESPTENVADNVVRPDSFVTEAGAYQGFRLPSADESGLVDPSIQLDESQVAAIKMLVQEQYGCLIGAAGSGKTTSQRFFLHKIIYGDEAEGIKPFVVKPLDGKQGLNIALCAFTGIASQVIKQNMPSWLHPCCKTIHSLLEFAPVAQEVIKENGEIKEVQVFMPMRNAQNPLQHEIIIIDEASMVGLDLWHQLLDACQEGTKIFMVGDLNQLPPVMSQSVFAYALSEWPVAELTHIHRQKEEAANKIIDVAHAILNGKDFDFDDQTSNPNWRVIGFKLDNDPSKAGAQIVQIANGLRTFKVAKSIDPEQPAIYDPYRDRIITAGNGFDDNNSASAVQQFPINEVLARMIEPPTAEHPVFIIDAGRSRKRFAVNHRVMATKNEPPDVVDRITNGMVGQIISIEKNPKWDGRPGTVGPEEEVKAFQRTQIDLLRSNGNQVNGHAVQDLSAFTNLDLSTIGVHAQESSREGGGPASHIITVRFVTGAVRQFASKAQVDSLSLAYASTCHKCQGSQMDTAIVIVHHAVKNQLSREWFYTAVTRAVKRVILLYTSYGIKNALAKQKIFGRTLEEKIRRYKALAEAEEDRSMGLIKTRVRLRIED